MKTVEELETMLGRLDRPFERADDGTFLVALAPGQPPAALRLELPVLVAQVAVGDVPALDDAASARFFRRLLELNGNSLLHAAFALQGAQLVLAAALEVEHLDLNELEALLADFAVALVQHVPELRKLSPAVAH